jgi:hypothetical protein
LPLPLVSKVWAAAGMASPAQTTVMKANILVDLFDAMVRNLMS